MSLTFAAVQFFNDTPAPRLRRSRSLNEISEKLQIPTQRKRATSAASDANRLLDRELDALENHVPSSRSTIRNSIETSKFSLKLRYSKVSDRTVERPKIKRNFSPWWNMYEYTPLAPNCIRLICFKPSPFHAPTRVAFELIEVSLEDAPSYEALSYRWSSIRAAHKVTCDGKVLFVSGNCQSALKRLNIENRRLWVDAICINQQDSSERGSQVSLMAQIYSKAERTIAWLGEDKDLGASCLADINGAVPYLKLSSNTQNWPTKDMPLSSKMNKNSIITLLRDDALGPSLAMSKLLRRPWFSRMWIQQEVALAKDIWIYCGNQSTTWSAFSSVLKALKAKSKLSKDFRAAWNLATFRHQYQKNRDSGGVDIHTAMVQARQCDTTNMLDKVYALLGVCSELARFVGQPDYELPVSIIWTRAQRAYLASHLSINALSLVSVGKQFREDLPSWVPDLSNGVRTWPRRPPSPTPTDGQAIILQCSGNSDSCLHAWGTFVDTVSQTYGQTENGNLEQMLEQCRSWWRLWQEDPKFGIISPNGVVPFWSTLYCDVNEFVPRTDGDQDVLKWHSRVIDRCLLDGKFHDTVLSEDEEAFPGIRVVDYIESTSNKMFGTTEGSIGLFPGKAQNGDRVVLFAGGTMPYLLRITSRTRKAFRNSQTPCFRRNGAVYELIGPCYVYGLTDNAERAKYSSTPQEILIF